MFARLHPEEYDRLIALARSHGFGKPGHSPVTVMLEAIAYGQVNVRLNGENWGAVRGGNKTQFRMNPESESLLKDTCLELGLTYANKPAISSLLKRLADGTATITTLTEQE